MILLPSIRQGLFLFNTTSTGRFCCSHHIYSVTCSCRAWYYSSSRSNGRSINGTWIMWRKWLQGYNIVNFIALLTPCKQNYKTCGLFVIIKHHIITKYGITWSPTNPYNTSRGHRSQYVMNFSTQSEDGIIAINTHTLTWCGWISCDQQANKIQCFTNTRERNPFVFYQH